MTDKSANNLWAPPASDRRAAVQSFDYVIFGATGDLTFRKLLPALFYCHRDGLIDAESRIHRDLALVFVDRKLSGAGSSRL